MTSVALRHLRVALLGCLLMTATFSSASGQTTETAARKSPQALVVLIGGMDSDPTPEQIAGKAKRDSGNSGLYRLQGDLRNPGIVTEYFNWNGTRAGKLNSQPRADVTVITDVIHQHVRLNARGRVILVGNSWGGHTTWEVCQSLADSPAPVAIDYVVFLDPSSTGRANTVRPKILPININRATNLYTRNLFGWRRWPQEDRIENIDLGDSQHGFLVKGGPAYDSSFDFSAHVAAEWDERIHASIKRKILDLALNTGPDQPAAQKENRLPAVVLPTLNGNSRKSP